MHDHAVLSHGQRFAPSGHRVAFLVRRRQWAAALKTLNEGETRERSESERRTAAGEGKPIEVESRRRGPDGDGEKKPLALSFCPSSAGTSFATTRTRFIATLVRLTRQSPAAVDHAARRPTRPHPPRHDRAQQRSSGCEAASPGSLRSASYSADSALSH